MISPQTKIRWIRFPIALLLQALLAGAAVAQTSYPATANPDGSWGGYELPAQVPYQPTLSSDGGVPVAAAPNPVWQTYAPGVEPNGAPVVLDGTAPCAPPVAGPAVPPFDSGYSLSSEPDLKQSLIPPGSRNGFFQKAKFTATWLPQPDSDSLGWTDLRTEVVTALPFFTRENPIIITPSYEAHFLNGPDNLALPPRLHDIAMDFHVFRVYDNHWIADVAVTPGLFADDNSFDSSEALRINGRAIGVYAPSLDLKWAFGITYLDGGWSKVVPVVGVMYTPTDDVEYQLVFPTPRIAWRLANSPIPGRDDYWVYVGLEYGNAAWAIQSNGTDDVLASRDYRAILGLERRVVGSVSGRMEVGYVFNRDIKLASLGGNDISMGSTLLLRAGISY